MVLIRRIPHHLSSFEGAQQAAQILVRQRRQPGTTLAFAALGLLFTFNSTWVNLGWAWAASWVAGRARMLARVTRWLDGVAGAVFIAFAARLALTEAPAAH